MVKNVFVKVLVLSFLFVGFVYSPALSAQTSQSTTAGRNALQGAWEMRTGGNHYVIVFKDQTFTIYRDGVRAWDSIYSLDPVDAGSGLIRRYMQNPPPRVLILMFGTTELWGAGFTYNISANELVISDALFGNNRDTGAGNRFDFLNNRWSRTSFAEPTEARNPLIGLWKSEGAKETEIFRFFPGGDGGVYGFSNSPTELQYAIDFTYKFGTTLGAGEISLLRYNWGTDSNEVYRVYPFTVNGDILRLEGINADYRRIP